MHMKNGFRKDRHPWKNITTDKKNFYVSVGCAYENFPHHYVVLGTEMKEGFSVTLSVNQLLEKDSLGNSCRNDNPISFRRQGTVKGKTLHVFKSSIDLLF